MSPLTVLSEHQVKTKCIRCGLNMLASQPPEFVLLSPLYLGTVEVEVSACVLQEQKLVSGRARDWSEAAGRQGSLVTIALSSSCLTLL